MSIALPLLILPQSLARPHEDKDLSGLWYDPKHGGCLRRITGNKIIGVYGDDETSDGTWYANFIRNGRQVNVHFVGKPEKVPKCMVATLSRNSLRWSDGNVWRRMNYHKNQLKHIR